MVLLADLLGCLFQVPHPAVVAKALPQLVQQLVIAVCQGFYGWQGLQEPGVVALDGLHTGLLQHDFRQPHMIGIPVGTPGKVAFIFIIPGQQKPRQGRKTGMLHGNLLCNVVLQQHRIIRQEAAVRDFAPR